MIAVIGATFLRGEGPTAIADGLAARIATAAAAEGNRVELIAKVGDDPAGDAVLLALARAGIGHVAVLRDAVHGTPTAPDAIESDDTADDDPDGGVGDAAVGRAAAAAAAATAAAAAGTAPAAPELESADVGLALRYLPDLEVIVAVHPTPAIAEEVIAAADWAGACLVIVSGAGSGVPPRTPPSALVLEVADSLADVAGIGARLGAYAAAAARGDDLGAAFAATVSDPEAGPGV